MSDFRNKLQAALGRKAGPEDLCRACGGQGQTRETRTEMKRVDGKMTTTAQGSGCPKCHGVGRVTGRAA